MYGLARFKRSTAPSNGMDAQRSAGGLLSSPAAAQRCAKGAGLDSGTPDAAQSVLPSIALSCSARSPDDDFPPRPPRPVAPQLQSRISTTLTGVTQPLIGPLPPGVQRRPLIVGERLSTQTRARRRQLRAQLWTRPGVFLSGATQQQARRWAMRQARPFGGTVTTVDQHAGGRPHFHIEFPPGAPVPTQRSGHIFYGTPPAGSFFEFDNV